MPYDLLFLSSSEESNEVYLALGTVPHPQIIARCHGLRRVKGSGDTSARQVAEAAVELWEKDNGRVVNEQTAAQALDAYSSAHQIADALTRVAPNLETIWDFPTLTRYVHAGHALTLLSLGMIAYSAESSVRTTFRLPGIKRSAAQERIETFLPEAVAPLLDGSSAATQADWAEALRELCALSDCAISSQVIHRLPDAMRLCLDEETATSLAPHVLTALSRDLLAREKIAAQMHSRPRVVVPEGREGLREVYLTDALYTLHRLNENAGATIAPEHGIRAALGFGDQWRAYVALAIQVSPIGLMRGARSTAPVASAVYSLIGVRVAEGTQNDSQEHSKQR